MYQGVSQDSKMAVHNMFVGVVSYFVGVVRQKDVFWNVAAIFCFYGVLL